MVHVYMGTFGGISFDESGSRYYFYWDAMKKQCFQLRMLSKHEQKFQQNTKLQAKSDHAW